MMNETAIQVDEKGNVALSGELTFESTPSIYRQLESQFQSAGEIVSVDLAQIGQTDSAGLALLLEWQAMANRHQRTLEIVNAPDILMRLAKLAEADKLLHLSPRDEQQA